MLKTKYPSDYGYYNGSENRAKGIQKLKDNNILSLPVERRLIKQEGSSSTYKNIAATLTSFKSSACLADTIWELKLTGSSDTSMSYINSNGLNKNSDYISRIAFLKYDINQNLIEQKLINNISKSYIWDYQKSYPIAEVINADSASVCYTSFEADGKGGWSYSGSTNISYFLTGAKSYFTGGGNITKTGLSSGIYIVSYWGRSGSVNVNSAGPTRTGKTIGSWTYYEHELSATSIAISGNNYIDELRLYPKGAQMTTATYIPLVGVNSQCDVNNRILFYEYDSTGRLKLIKDEDGKILKYTEYKYQGTSQQ